MFKTWKVLQLHNYASHLVISYENVLKLKYLQYRSISCQVGLSEISHRWRIFQQALKCHYTVNPLNVYLVFPWVAVVADIGRSIVDKATRRMMAFLSNRVQFWWAPWKVRIRGTQIISGLTRYVYGFLLLCYKGSNMEFNLTSMLFIYVLFKKNMPL